MRYFAIISILALTACGVDGEPDSPQQSAPAPGLSISGTAEIGVSGSF